MYVGFHTFSLGIQDRRKELGSAQFVSLNSSCSIAATLSTRSYTLLQPLIPFTCQALRSSYWLCPLSTTAIDRSMGWTARWDASNSILGLSVLNTGLRGRPGTYPQAGVQGPSVLPYWEINIAQL